MKKKHHPHSRKERLELEKIKAFGKKTTDRPGRVRRKLELETVTVKELEDALRNLKVSQGTYEEETK